MIFEELLKEERSEGRIEAKAEAILELLEVLGGIGTDLRAVCIVSQLHLAPLADAPADLAQADIAECGKLAVSVAKAVGEKCERCWIYSDELGSDPEHPTLCPRCAAVMKELA